MNITTLYSNLYHLAHANTKNDLTHSYWGHCLYSVGWRARITCFRNSETVDENIKEMEKAFQSTLKDLKKHIEKYQQYLHQALNGKEVDFPEEARRKIHDWNRWIHPVLKRNVTDKMKQFIPNSTLTEAFQVDLLAKRLQRVIDMEIELDTPLPLFSFRQLSEEQVKPPPTELKKWIERFVERDAKVRTLHKALLILFENPCTVADLEWNLHNAFPKKGLWKQKDEKHIQWRRSLATSKKITYYHNGQQRTITLDKALGAEAESNHVTFSIQGDSEHVIVVCNNRALTALEKLEYQDKSPNSLERVEVEFISSDGRFKMMQRFGKPVSIHKWTSRGKTLNSNDQPLANQLAQLNNAMLQGPYLIRHLAPKYLLYDSKELKTFKVLIPQKFDFNTLEKNISSQSKKNPWVFRYLMEQSGAHQHYIANFYHEVVASALTKNNTNVNDIAIRKGVNNQKTIDQAIQLVRNVKRRIEYCRHELEGEGVDFKEKQLRQVFLEEYQQKRTASILWPTIVDDVVKIMKKDS